MEQAAGEGNYNSSAATGTPETVANASSGKFRRGRQQQQQQLLEAGCRRLSVCIEMLVHNEDGEAEEVEIDVADADMDAVPPLIKDGNKCRRQSIAERISRRRHSEVAVDIIRLSAAHRKRELAQLIDEHQAIVRELQETRGKPGHVSGGQRSAATAIQECAGDKENIIGDL